jgi:hypothetical protein
MRIFVTLHTLWILSRLRICSLGKSVGVSLAWLLVLGVLGGEVRAATYYVSASAGDDARTASQAQSSVTPWRTLQKAASSMAAGDTCVIAGGTYRETVTPAVNNLIFEAADGEVPIISGCDLVTGWTPHTSNVYRATVNTRVRALFANGAHMQLARFPNEDGDPFSTSEWAATSALNTSVSGTGTATITFTGAAWADNQWVGGRYWGLHGTNFYQGDQGRITASTADTITITDLNGTLQNGLDEFEGAGVGYIINQLAALDAPTEWHWVSNTLYYYAAGGVNPGAQSVEARVRLWGFDLSGRTGITLKGLRFFASSVLIEGGNSNTIDTCAFLYHSPWGDHREPFTNAGERGQYEYGSKEDGTAGVFVCGSQNTIQNSYFAHAWGLGVHFREGSANVVDNCLFEDINWLGKQNGAAVFINGPDHVVRNSTVRRCAAMGICASQIVNSLVRRPLIWGNDISETGLMLIDGGQSAVYINNHNAASVDRTLGGGRIAYNRIGRVNIARENNKGFGLYMDDGTHGVTIDHNVIYAGAGVRWPIFSNGAGHQIIDFNVYNNTIWDYRDATNAGGFVSSLAINGTGNRVSVRASNNLAQRLAYREINGPQGDATLAANLSNVLAAEFVSVNARDFRLVAGSPAIDAGVVIPGITDGYAGSAPDIGAFESGVTPWTAGSTLTGDPTGMNGSSPTAPSGLVASLEPDGRSVRLTWTDNANNETEFRLERSANGDAYQQITILAANVTTYLDATLPADVTYTYRVRAGNAFGSSLYSLTAAVRVPGSTTTSEHTPVADAWVRSDQTTVNNGSGQTLLVQQSGSRVFESYLRFTPNTPANQVVVAARLILREGNGGTAANNNSRISLRTVTGTWTESTVTWATKPAYASTELATIAASSIEENEIVEVTLPTTLFGAGGSLELALVGTTTGQDLNFIAREAIADQPRLILILQAKVSATAEAGTPLALLWRALNDQEFTWTKTSGPGSVVFSTDEAGRPVATFAQAGAYVLTGTNAANTYPYQVNVTVVAAAADADSDSLTDAWEYQHFGDTLSALPNEDSDGDGWGNRLEQAWGTDPRVRNPSPVTLSGTAPLTLRFSRNRAAGAPPVTPQTSADLLTWQAVTASPRIVVQTTWAETVEVDLPAPVAGRRFGRVTAP